MRKSLIISLIMMFVFAATTFCAEVSLKWDAVDGATGYNLYQSFDMGATWSTGADMGAQVAVTVTVMEAGLVLFKVSAYNANGETVTEWQGAWYNYQWRPLDAPVGLGVQ